MKLGRKLSGLALVLSLALLAGCSGGQSWVMKTATDAPPAGIYLTYLINAASGAKAKLAEQNKDTEGYVVPAKYSDVLKESIDGRPVSEWMVAEAQKQLKEYLAINHQFAEKGLTLTPEQLETAKATAKNNWNTQNPTTADGKTITYGEFCEKNGIALSSMELQMQNSLKRSTLFESFYGVGGESAVSEDELKNIFASEYGMAEYLIFEKAGAERTDVTGQVLSIEDQDAAKKQQAQDYLERLTAGEPVETLAYELMLAEATGDITQVEMPEPGSLTIVVNQSMKGVYFSDQFVDGIMALSNGGSAVLEDEYLFYVVRRLDIMEDPAIFDRYRNNILTELKGEEFTNKIAEWAATLSVETNDAAIKGYAPSKLKLD